MTSVWGMPEGFVDSLLGVRRCPHCLKQVRTSWVTCGKSACQKAEFYANKERAAARSKRAWTTKARGKS